MVYQLHLVVGIVRLGGHDVVKDPAVEFWITVSEKAIRDPMGVKEKADGVDDLHQFERDYERVGKMMSAILIEKNTSPGPRDAT